MFDPFGDFEQVGYLRNLLAEKDLELVKIAEHQLFRAQLPVALDFLAKLEHIEYADFLEVHRIIFSGLYPWAGKDRLQVLPDRAILKGGERGVYFAHPQACRLAIEQGLALAQSGEIAKKPGLIMGLLAFGHPFLDGNGRVMLLVHAELCFRAGMSINWMKTDKDSYLKALTKEIQAPDKGYLDDYLNAYITKKIPREIWLQSISALPGLNGLDSQLDASAQYDDPTIAKEYEDFERNRNYKPYGKQLRQ